MKIEDMAIKEDAKFSSDRRKMLVGAGALGASAVAAMALGSTDALAGDMMHHHGAKRDEALIKALHQCVRTGEACIDHCLALFKKGDVETVDCMRSVIDTVAFCKAHTQLASSSSRHLNAMTELGMKVCEACEKECRKHEKKHAECKACAEACADCVKACKAHLRA